MNNGVFAAVFIDDVSDSPTIACPGHVSNKTFSLLDSDCVLDVRPPSPLANSTFLEEEGEPPAHAPVGEQEPDGNRGDHHADRNIADLHLDVAHGRDGATTPDPGAKGLRVGPREYAYIVKEIWPFTDPRFCGVNYHLDIYDLVRATGVPNYLSARIRIPSNINCDAWDQLLHGYHDAEVSEYLRFGWPGGYTAPTPPHHLYQESSFCHFFPFTCPEIHR